MELSQRLDHLPGLATTYENLGGLAFGDGNYSEALQWFHKAREIQNLLGIPADLAVTCNNLGRTYSELRDQEAALNWYMKGLELSNNLGAQRLRADLLANLAILLWNMGQVQKAKAYFVDSLMLYEELQATEQIKKINKFIEERNGFAESG